MKKRPVFYNIRLTTEEKAALDFVSKRRGTSVSDVLRRERIEEVIAEYLRSVPTTGGSDG